jgi:DNA-binding ferritin-like protein (Dps family)
VLTREPSGREMKHFHRRLQETPADKYLEAMEDIYWTLLNSSEFSWNH